MAFPHCWIIWCDVEEGNDAISVGLMWCISTYLEELEQLSSECLHLQSFISNVGAFHVCPKYHSGWLQFPNVCRSKRSIGI